MQILVLILMVFAGFAVGRLGHIYLGELPGLHHWIFGLIFIILGFVFYNYFWAVSIICFGVGHFISDLKDFAQFKFYGRDEKGLKKFWGID